MAGMTFLSGGNALQNLGLALMAGGMLAIGAFCAPVIFKAFPRHEAGAALTVVFIRYDVVLLIAMGMVIIGEGLRIFSQHVVLYHPIAYIRYGLMFLLTIALVVSTQIVNPRIQQMQQHGVHPDASQEGIEFAKTHKLSENLYKFEMLLAAGLLLLTPWLPGRE